jgi:hypothetical protein
MEEEWEELFSEKHQKKYWKNKASGKTSWKDPKTTGDAIAKVESETAKPTEASGSTNDEWEELFSEKHNRKYWKNKSTGKTQWTNPAPASALNAAAATSATSEQKESSSSPSGDTDTAKAQDEWVEMFSEKHKKKYWKNKSTGKTSWTDPASTVADDAKSAASPPPADAAKAEEWEELFSEKHKRKYWKNKSSGKTQWTDPNAASKAADAAAAAAGTVSKGGSFTSTVSALTAVTESAPPAGSDSKNDEWVEGYSEKHKRAYWKNKTTGKTSWTKPESTAASTRATTPVADDKSVAPSIATAAAAATATATADSEWVESYSEKHKRKFWKNKVTGKTSWTPPPPPPPVSVPVAKPSAEEKKSEEHATSALTPVVVPVAASVEKPKSNFPIVYRTMVRILSENTNLYLFELHSTRETTEVILHHVVNEDSFLEKTTADASTSALFQNDRMTTDDVLSVYSKFPLSSIKKLICNKVSLSSSSILQYFGTNQTSCFFFKLGTGHITISYFKEYKQD